VGKHGLEQVSFQPLQKSAGWVRDRRWANSNRLLADGARILLNIGKPRNRATLHNEFCELVPKPLGTKLKPMSRLGTEGGWFHVAPEVEGQTACGYFLAASELLPLPKVLAH
jgi:hypothetical protein